MSESGLQDSIKEHKLEQDYKREINNRKKWALGERVPGEHSLPSKRPVKPTTSSHNRTMRRSVEYQQNTAAQIAKISRKHQSRVDTDTSLSDSSAEEGAREAAAASELDAGYIYSFDSPRGPGKGSQILGMALAKAVEKYEYRATEKLVKDEYEVVGDQKGEDGSTGYTADEDDFEFV